jgi:surfactin synthase thioesterase subunit/acyl carrier protein
LPEQVTTVIVPIATTTVISHTQESLVNYLREQLARMAGFSPTKLDVLQPINKMGLDSILALELKNRVETDLKVKLPIISFFQGANIEQIAAQLLKQLQSDSDTVPITPETISTTLPATQTASVSSAPSGVDANASATPSNGQESLVDYLRERIANAAGYLPAKLDIYKPINRIGLDSLLAMELKNQIERELKIEVAVSGFVQGANIVQVAEQLSQQLREKQATSNGNSSKAVQQSNNIADQNEWIIRFRANPDARLRLFCFPFAGIGASLFRSWPDQLPSEVELCAVELPGHETRWNEPLFTQLDSLIKATAAALRPYLDRPFAFFGHSIGGLIIFELARYLRREYQIQPVRLLVSAYLDPRMPVTDSPVQNLSDTQFIEQMKIFGGLPSQFTENEELKAIFLPILRADAALFSNYHYQHELPLDLPITGFCGLQDQKMTEQSMLAWKQQTTQLFKLQILPGNHFFIQDADNRNLLLQAISTDLRKDLEKLPVGKLV